MAFTWGALIGGTAAVAALLVCQHLLLLGLVALFNRRFQPIFWLFRCSRPAIRAALHLSTLIIFAVGVALGSLLGSNLLLAICAVLVATISFGTEWTFMGNWGPLATLLRTRERDYLERARAVTNHPKIGRSEATGMIPKAARLLPGPF